MPELLRDLSALRKQIDPSSALARRVIAGALVDLGVKVPADIIRHLTAEFPVEGMVLAARDPSGNRGFLKEVIEDDNGYSVTTKTAACNVLLQWEELDLAESLVGGGIVITLKLVESPNGSLDSWSFSGKGSWLKVPKDFPSVTVRSFCREGPDAKIMVDGPVPVYYSSRMVSPGEGFGDSAFRDSSWRDRRLIYLQCLSGINGLEVIASSRGVEVLWKNGDHFLDAAQEIRVHGEAKWAEVVSELVEAELIGLTVADRVMTLVKLEVEDHRREKTDLPVLVGK